LIEDRKRKKKHESKIAKEKKKESADKIRHQKEDNMRSTTERKKGESPQASPHIAGLKKMYY